jgi:hypothetical protein
LNRRDVEEIPAPARAGIRFEYLKTVDDALAHALEKESAREFPEDAEMAATTLS